MRASLEINGQTIEAGEVTDINIHVGKLASGAQINIRAHVNHSKIDGPTVLIIGGVHGDEINGVQIVRKVTATGILDKVIKGTIITIPLLNVYGFLNFRRDLPDGKDVNRSFPGNIGGSLASRMAGLVTKKILPHVNFVIDFHTGGASRYNYPQIRYTRSDLKAKELARIFGAPFAIPKGMIPKSLRKICSGLKIPIIVFEGGEAQRKDSFSIEIALNGIQRVLHHLEMIDAAPLRMRDTIHLTKTGWLRATRAGLFTAIKVSGAEIKKRETIGELADPYGYLELKVLTNKDAFIIGHNNAPVVNQGDALFHLGYEFEIWEKENT